MDKRTTGHCVNAVEASDKHARTVASKLGKELQKKEMDMYRDIPEYAASSH